MNLANVICDKRENIWVIDWTHAGIHPLELDFAKLENDVKFVMSKQFQANDFAKLDLFEEYLLANPIPNRPFELPKPLEFVTWDLRFKKILSAVRQIRQAYFSLKDEDDWFIYRVALLKYSVHTLSFDQSRNRGECAPVQLWYALSSVEQLLFDLVADDFHLKIRGERPSTYPERLRISIDQAIWTTPCPDYSPPYHVDPEVLRNDKNKVKGGWADSEESWQDQEPDLEADFSRDSDDKPLNPHGRTGISGRGILGRWGPNLVAIVLVTRFNKKTKSLEILLTEREADNFDLLENFVKFKETFEHAAERVLRKKVQVVPDQGNARIIHDGYLYDYRQTDNAWVAAKAFLFHLERDPSIETDETQAPTTRMIPLTPELVNDFSTSKASLIRKALEVLLDQKLIKEEIADLILRKTG